MKYTIFLTDKAFEDLDYLTSYIAYDLLSPETAKNIYQMILQRIEGLSESHLIHPKIDIAKFKPFGIRKMILKQYRVFYLTQSKPPQITVIRILHQLQDQSSALSEVFYV